jgi:hypothetical protein
MDTYSDDGSGSVCDSDNLLCKEGSRGALCGSCEDAFIYSSAERVCVACDESQTRTLIFVGTTAGAALVVGGLFFSGALQRMPRWVSNSQVAGAFRQIDSGALRVAWANYQVWSNIFGVIFSRFSHSLTCPSDSQHQIVQSVSWSLDVTFPSPFTKMLSLLSVFSFDFLSLECIFENSNHFTSVYLWSLTSITVAVLLTLNHLVRSRLPGGSTTSTADLTYQLLLLGYMVLPSVSLKQLQAIDCVEVAGKSYLRVDTSVDCDSSDFRSFRVVDTLFLVAYLSTPLIWLALLLAKRKSLNPAPTTGADKKLALFLRDQNEMLKPLRFLFSSYTPFFFFVEVVEM